MDIDLNSTPTVSVTGTVRAPVADVWAVFKPFGDIMSWWNIYEWVKLEDPGKDEVGAVRNFLTKTGRTYREKLVSRDDATYTERYDMLSVSPAVPTFKGAVTIIAMSDNGDGTTHVAWKSWSDAGSLLLGQIKATQTEVYVNAIKDLDRHFNPALGKLEVTVVGAKDLKRTGLFPVDAYALVQLDHGEVHATTTRHLTTHPVFNDAMTLEVLDTQGTLKLSVWDANVGQDTPLGAAEVDLHTLKNGQAVRQDLTLDGGGGTLTVTLKLALTDGDALPETAVQAELDHIAAIEGALDKLKTQALQIVQQVAAGDEATYAYDRYPRSPQIPDVPLENLPRMVHGLPRSEALSPRKISRMLERGVEYLYSQVDFLKRGEANEADPYLAYFGGWIEANEHLLAHWQDDRELARQFIAGVCPMILERVRDLDRVPASLRDLQLGGEGLGSLVERKALFLLDYSELAGLDNYQDMFFYAPYALLYKPAGEEALTIGAIQLDRTEGAEVYTPDRTPPNRWLFAKVHLACADNQYHQWLYHLGFGHLAMEPFVVAAHNGLPEGHVVRDLLAPHFRDTLGINFLARQTLVSEIAPFTDRTFSTGTAQALQMFLAVWEKYDFFAQGFAAQLAARGFDADKTDALEGYWYREDGFKIWNAIGTYVRGVVDATYADDGAVAADGALQAWAVESTHPDKADIRSFPKAFASKARLVDTLQTLIWSVSAHHSAVNFSQYPYLSYVPNRPDSLFAAMPPGQDEIELSVVTGALPNPIISHFQISFAWLLSLPTEHSLADVDAMAERFPEVHQAFQAELAGIGEAIQARNAALEARGEASYPFLIPDRIASSIAI